MSDVLALVEAQRARLDKLDAQALRALIQAYRSLYERSRGEIDALVLAIEQSAPTASQVRKMRQFQAVLETATEQLTKFEGYTETQLLSVQAAGRGIGGSDALTLMAEASGDARLRTVFRSVPPEVLEQLVNYIAPGKPLYKRLQLLAPETVQRIADAILEDVALGRNPRTIARSITRAYGMGLTDAMRMMRTVQLYSYRDTNRATYMANSDVVKGWTWWARLDPSCCMSCVAMHGSFHGVDERLNDHHNGRCMMVPVTILGEPQINEGAGKAWFEGLPEAQQRKQMGRGKYEAWKGGKFSFEQLPASRADDVYGVMRTEASLTSLIGTTQ